MSRDVLSEADALIEALENRAPAEPAPRRVSARGRGQLFHRIQASLRLPPMPCGCRDPLSYQHIRGDHAGA